MVRVRLKKLLKKEPLMIDLINQISNQFGQEVSILGNKGEVILGNLPSADIKDEQLVFQGNAYGCLYAGEATSILAPLLINLIQKEYEKRKLGSEVLDLYREINLMHKFSQKLSATINQGEIADLTLTEMKQLIKARAGGIIYFHDHKSEFQVLSRFSELEDGPSPFEQKSFIQQYFNKESRGEIINHLKLEGLCFSLLYTPLKVQDQLLGYAYLISEEVAEYTAADLKLANTLSTQSAVALHSSYLYQKNLKAVQEREKEVRNLHQSASRFVPSAFLEFLGYEEITQVNLGDSVEAEVTVLFSDIRGYTTLSEGMTPRETFRFVTAFNNRMGPIIQKNNGFVNQYLGDGIMAIFPKSPLDALNTAIEMQLQLQVYNLERQKKGRPPISVGIGLHTGSLILGVTGDQTRLDAATISDTVNTASRIESLTKKYGVNILMSGESLSRVFNQIGDSFIDDYLIRYLGQTKVKGKQQLIEIYECFNGDLPEIMTQKKEYLDCFESVIRCFDNQNFLDAISVLQGIHQDFPRDKTTAFLLDKFGSLLPSEK